MLLYFFIIVGILIVGAEPPASPHPPGYAYVENIVSTLCFNYAATVSAE